MPVFYQRSDGSGFYAKASIQGSIVTFQFTERGVGVSVGWLERCGRK